MATTLPNQSPPHKLTRKCPGGCGRWVLSARDDHGRLVVLEWCIRAKGTHTITAGLFDGFEPTATVSAGKGFRIHACTRAAQRAHSAASFERKRAAGGGR